MNELARDIARALLRDQRVSASQLCRDDLAAFRQAVRELIDLGFDVQTQDGATVGLASLVDRLDETRIRDALHPRTRAALAGLRLETIAGSTNALALAGELPDPGRMRVYLADFQWAGRGRRGAPWQSPPATGLCLSMALRLPATTDLSALSLACGVSLRRGLLAAGASGLQLKWPNDLVVDGRKLGGLLVELRQIPGAPTLIVIGVGLNVSAAPRLEAPGALPPVALVEVCDGALPSRSDLAAAVTNALWDGVDAFAVGGFGAFDDAWREADFLHGRAVRVLDDARICGVARGVNARGELLIDTGDGVQAIRAGEVSVRPVSPA